MKIFMHYARKISVLLSVGTLLVFSGHSLAAPKIQSWQTSQGSAVYFIESNALPMFDLHISWPAGQAYDPDDKMGLASLTVGMLSAGAGPLSESQIADKLADVGAVLNTGADEDRSFISLRTLSYETERAQAMEVLQTLIAQPSFPEDILAREKDRTIVALKEALTKPGTLAAQAWLKTAYAQHPYGKIDTPESIARITREDLAQFYQTRYRAAQATITLVGKLSREEATTLAERLSNALPKGQKVPTELPSPKLVQQSQTHIANPSNQTHIILGMPGMSREDPDYYSLLVGNYILGGGGFVSRLMKEVREKRGFAYSVNSSLEPLLVPGPFQINLQTKGTQRDEALRVSLETLQQFINKGPTQEELKAAKDNYVNGFGLRLDSNKKLISYLDIIAFYRLPLDWLERYPQEVAKLTASQVQDAFKRRIDPAHFVIVTAGGEADVATPVEASTPSSK